MKDKKVIIILGAIILVSIGILCLGMAIFLGMRDDRYIKTAEEGDVSRYQWMEMLCEQSGLTEYKDATPYYEDVNADNPYFSYIQSAVEWSVLGGDAKFSGDSYASGRFVAVTAMKTIGERKLMLYFDTEDGIAEDTYLELALEHGLIEKEQLAEGLSAEECEQILESLKELNFNTFWRDDYSQIIFQDDVIELSRDDVLQTNTDGSQIVVSDEVLDALKEGAIIVYEKENTKLKFAREITAKSPDGTLLLSPVELEQVVESLTVSDITEVTFEDIVKDYAQGEGAYAFANLYGRQGDERLLTARAFSGRIDSKGFKITLSTSKEEDADEKQDVEKNGKKADRHLEVTITDHSTEVSETLPIGGEVKLAGDYSAELDIDQILIGAQADYRCLRGGLQYAEVAVDIHSTVKGEIKAQDDVKLPLYKTPVPIPLAGGIAGIDVQFFLVISAEGTISVEAELPVGASVTYEKDKGLRYRKHAFQPGYPKIEANCECGYMFRFEPTLVALGDVVSLLDVEFDAGMTAGASITTQPNLQICTETAISFPVVTISVCGDDKAKTLLGELGWSAEWEIINSENAPIQINTHFEVLPDKTAQFVEACTYKEGETGEVVEGTEEMGKQPEDDSDEREDLPLTESLQLVFTSSAGAWATNLDLDPDGSFTGEYHDYDMTAAYTAYVCQFHGRFGKAKKLTDASWQMTLEELELDTGRHLGEEWEETIAGDTFYCIASAPSGFCDEDGTVLKPGAQFCLYGPEAKGHEPGTELYGEMALQLNSLTMQDFRGAKDVLGCWALQNSETKEGFFEESALY